MTVDRYTHRRILKRIRRLFQPRPKPTPKYRKVSVLTLYTSILPDPVVIREVVRPGRTPHRNFYRALHDKKRKWYSVKFVNNKQSTLRLSHVKGYTVKIEYDKLEGKRPPR